MATIRTRLAPLGTALWAGMAWGLLFGLVENVPCLVQGKILNYVDLRLRAIVFTTVLYAILFSVAAGAVGLLTTAVLALRRRPAARPPLLGLYFGLLVGATATASWLQTYGLVAGSDGAGERSTAIALGAAAGAVVGIVVGGLVYGAARWWEAGPAQRRPFLRRFFRWIVPALVLSAALALTGLGLYRNGIRPLLPRPADNPATAERPNIILITVDSLRADHLGAYGYDPAISPHIDALARRGIMFRQAIAQSSWTLPSVSSMITSLHPTELGIRVQRDSSTQATLDPLRTTLAEALQQAGYHTQAYLTNPWLRIDNGYAQGFDGFIGARPDEPFDREALVQRPLLGLVWNHGPKFLQDALWLSYEYLFDPHLTMFSSGLYVDLPTMDFLDRYKDQRFFLWVYYMEPHSNYHPTQAFPSLPPGTSPEEEHFLRFLEFWILADAGPSILKPDQIPALISLYDGEIHDVDYWIGRLIEELGRRGLTDRTLIVLHSDHGEEFADHGRFAHGHALYDELIRVPLIIAGPGIVSPGRAVDTPVQLLDIMPTLLEIAGAPLPAEAHGRSLVPFLRGGDRPEEPIFSEKLHTTVYEQKAVRYRGWKLIYRVLEEKVELYDLRNDPYERVNLAEAQPARVEEYMGLLRRWLAQALRTADSRPHGASPPPMDDPTREMLRKSGY